MSLPLTIVSTVILARELGADGFGRYALYAFVVTTVIVLSDCGLTMGFVQRGARAFGDGDRETLERLAGQALTWALLRWPFVYAGLAIFLDDRIATALLAFVAVAAVLQSGVGLTLLCTVRNAELSRISLVAAVFAASATIGFALAGAPPSRVFAAGLAAQWLGLSLQALYLRGDRAAKRAPYHPRSLVGTRQDFIFGSTTFASTQMTALALGRSELLFFGPGQGLARGIYAAAYTIGSRLTLPIDALYGALGASLAAVRGQGDAFVRGTTRTLRLSGSLFSLVAGPGLMLTLVGADLLFPATYEGIVAASIVLATASLLVSSANPIVALYYSQRRIRPLLLSAGSALAANVGLSVLLIRPFGIAGAVAANATSSSIYVLALLWPLLKDAALKSAVRNYVRVVGFALASAAAAAFAVSTLDDGLTRWAVAALLTGLQPLVVIRLLPSLDSTDITALRDHAPERLRPAFAWALRLLVPEAHR